MSPIYVPGKVVLAQGQPVPNDPNFAFNSLLLHGNGTNGSTVITDSSGSPKTVTAVGNAQISTAQSKFGGSSMLFDGTGDYLDSSRSIDFDFGTGDYTIEGWLFQSSFGINTLVDLRIFGESVAIYSSVSNSLLTLANNSAIIGTSTFGFSTNAWNHFAVTRSAGTCRGFTNGNLGFTITDNRDLKSTTGNLNCRIGSNNTGGQGFSGYIDDLRITKGVARYTANFTPPTLPFPDF
jgi:hypothetical protein